MVAAIQCVSRMLQGRYSGSEGCSHVLPSSHILLYALTANLVGIGNSCKVFSFADSVLPALRRVKSDKSSGSSAIIWERRGMQEIVGKGVIVCLLPKGM